MKTLHPLKTCISHNQPVGHVLRHPELLAGSDAQTDVELYSCGVLELPKGTCCTLISRTTYIATVEVRLAGCLESYTVPLYALHAPFSGSVQ